MAGTAAAIKVTATSIWSLPVPAAGPVSATLGKELTTGRQTIENVEVSPDGQWLVFDSDRSGNADLYRMPAAGGEPVRLTSDSGDPARQPARYGFSTDGRRFHVTIGSSESDVWVMRLERR